VDSGTVLAVRSLADAPLTTSMRVRDGEAAVEQFGSARLKPRGGVVEIELEP
jgi:hypothetical protein